MGDLAPLCVLSTSKAHTSCLRSSAHCSSTAQSADTADGFSISLQDDPWQQYERFSEAAENRQLDRTALVECMKHSAPSEGVQYCVQPLDKSACVQDKRTSAMADLASDMEVVEAPLQTFCCHDDSPSTAQISQAEAAPTASQMRGMQSLTSNITGRTTLLMRNILTCGCSVVSNM